MVKKQAEVLTAYDARTQWSRMLDRVRDGQHYIITKRGEPVASLVPLNAVTNPPKSKVEQAAELAALVEMLETQNERTDAALDRAETEIKKTRTALAQRRTERAKEGSIDNAEVTHGVG